MPVTIKQDAAGREVIWSERGGKPVPLVVEDIFIRASNGHVFKADYYYSPPRLHRLEPQEVAMVQHWLRAADGPHVPNVFAGEPPPDG